MAKQEAHIRLIFGFKIKHLRQQQEFSYQQLADRTGLAISYLHDIEKGKKYPKRDKIIALAKALEVDYDYLISLKADKKLQPVVDLLQSDILQDYPLALFGLKTNQLLQLFSNVPEKMTVFISTIFEITRNYEMTREHFYQAALRAYQNMHDNYFADLEQAVKGFRQEYALYDKGSCHLEALEAVLRNNYGLQIDRSLLQGHPELTDLRSYYQSKHKILYLNPRLDRAQQSFIIGRELAFQYLSIGERPLEMRILSVKSFDKLLNNFRASYFAAALLMDEQQLSEDLRQWFAQEQCNPRYLLTLLKKYEVTAEMLFQRLTNILPQHFDISNLFFLRLTGSADLERFHITKELHLSRSDHHPYSNELHEYYCRRWVAIESIKRLQTESNAALLADAQVSEYWESDKAYLCLTLAQAHPQQPEEGSSVTIGLLENDRLKQQLHFLKDSKLRRRMVNVTCQRCTMPDCDVRAAPPIEMQRKVARQDLKAAIKKAFE